MALVDSDAPGRRSFALWAGPGTSALRPALRARAHALRSGAYPLYRGEAPVGRARSPSVTGTARQSNSAC